MSTSGLQVVLAGGRERIQNGLAVADELGKLMPDATIRFAGPEEPDVAHQAAESGFEYWGVVSGQTSGLRSLADRWSGERAGRKLLQRAGSSIVLALGGTASDVMAKAALSQGVPLVLHEQHREATSTTRRFASRAAMICLAFEETRGQLDASCPMRVTGTPVPAAYSCVPRRAEGWPRVHRLVVAGDPRQHDPLNLFVARALYKVRGALDGWQISHQAGRVDLGEVREQYRRYGIGAIVTSRITNLPAAIACADLVIARASTISLASIAAAGAPALIVPHPAETASNQDALWLRDAGGCRFVEDEGPWLGDSLTHELSGLVSDDLERQRLSRGAHQQARADAAWKVASMIRDLALAGGNPLAA